MTNLGNLQGLIPIFGGVYCLLLASGILPFNPKDPEKINAWRQKFGGMVMVLSPLVIVFGVLQLMGFFK